MDGVNIRFLRHHHHLLHQIKDGTMANWATMVEILMAVTDADMDVVVIEVYHNCMSWSNLSHRKQIFVEFPMLSMCLPESYRGNMRMILARPVYDKSNAVSDTKNVRFLRPLLKSM
jgi:hypothetical protein